MNERFDAQLLRDYAECGNEAAFRELVIRHTDFVYSSALRQVKSPDLAADITQSVFADLARKARQIAVKQPSESSFTSWLHRSTRYAALKHLRDTHRRLTNERQAMEQLLTNSESQPDWEHIRPTLDEALDSLGDEDREALLLRYFKNHDFRAIGFALGVSDDAAQKRVTRAVERLRAVFAKRGITVGAGGVTALISANAVQSAPVGLAATISTAALAETTIATATKTIAMTTLQKALMTVATAIVIGTGIHEIRQNSALHSQVQTLERQMSPLASQNRRLQQERDDASNKLTALLVENEKLKNNVVELAKLRGEVTRLRKNASLQANDPIQGDMKSWLARVGKLKQRLTDSPSAKIPEMRFLNEDDYMDATRSKLETEGDYLAALASLRSTGEFKFITTMLNPALTQYAQANNGQFPTDLAQLKPYFPSPVEDAILDRWEIAPANTVRTDNFGDPIITQKAAIDEDFDPRYAVGLKGFASAGLDTGGQNGWGVVAPDVVLGPATQAAAQSYEAANGGQVPAGASQILPYLNPTTPEQQAALQKLMKWNQAK